MLTETKLRFGKPICLHFLYKQENKRNFSKAAGLGSYSESPFTEEHLSFLARNEQRKPNSISLPKCLCIPHHQQPAFHFPLSPWWTWTEEQKMLFCSIMQTMQDSEFSLSGMQTLWLPSSLSSNIITPRLLWDQPLVAASSSAFTHSKPGTRGKHFVPHPSGQSSSWLRGEVPASETMQV